MSELTIDFDEPYLGGGGGGAVSIPPWMVALNGRRYLLDTGPNYVEAKYKRESIDVLQQRNTNNNRDLLLLPQDIWRQQVESWHQGAGQMNADREDALPYRFYRSFGIDPWTKYELSLLNETTKLHNLTTSDPCWVQVHNGSLVAIYGDTSRWWATPASSPVTLSSGTTQQAISVTYDGDNVIVLYESGVIHQFTNATTQAARTVTVPVGTPNPVTDATFIAYVKDYLILGVGNELWNITATQAVLIYTSPVTGFTWKGAAEGNNAIYLIGGAGDKHVIHRIGIKDDGTLLTAAVVAASLPDGETGVAIGSYLGYVFIGTAKGVRMATPSGTAGDLALGALIPTAKPVYGFEGQDRFVWITASDVDSLPTGEAAGHDEYPTTPVCGLYRADLSTFTVSESTPAYAADLVAADQQSKTVRSVTTWNNKRVFAVDGGGIYMEQGTKIAGGWIEQGRISFSVEDLKTGLYAQGKWEPLHGTIEMYLTYDNTHPLRIMSWSIQDSMRSDNITLNGQQFSRVDARLDLLRDAVDHTLGPIFTRFELRARPVKGAASRWTLPLINHEELDLNGIPEARDVTEEFYLLLSLVESGKMFPLQEWGRAYNVVAKDFTWIPQKLNLGGTGWQGIFVMVAEEVR